MAHRIQHLRGGGGRGGFTLIEVLAAVVIFGIALVGYLQAVGESTRIQADLMSEQRALMLAQNAMEELRLGGQFEEGVEEGEFEEEDAGYFWRTDVQENAEIEGLIDVVVTVSWNDGVERKYSLTTQIAETSAGGTGTP
jgi:general secretion pathway protein I